MSSARAPSPLPLLSVADADRILAAFLTTSGGLWPAETVPLEAAGGRILREDVCADRAYPPQNRSCMDGIAIRHADLTPPQTPSESSAASHAFVVTGIARAGDSRLTLTLQVPASGMPGTLPPCMEIMTGAPVPEDSDTVIPYEDIVIEDGAVEVPGVPAARVARAREGAVIRPGKNVHREGSDCATGAVLVPAGTRLNAAHVAIAASVGLSNVLVACRPRVAVVATGDELVGVDETPFAHQLRVSNAHGLAAMLGPWAVASVHRVGDDPVALHVLLRTVLSTFDLVLISGGVSAGKFDAVPSTLESLGVEKVFHKLAQKPGKPLWFGTFKNPKRPEVSGDTPPPKPILTVPTDSKVPVFGLPGNPVSALMCARRFVLPLLWSKIGWSVPPAPFFPVGSAVISRPLMTQYLPVRLETKAITAPGFWAPSDFETVAEPRAVNGSGDFATLGASDGFVELPPSENHDPHYPAGVRMAFFSWLP